MDFSITPKQKEIIDLARTIAQEEIKPASLAIDKSGVIPEGLMRILKQSGMTALAVPKEYSHRSYGGRTTGYGMCRCSYGMCG